MISSQSESKPHTFLEGARHAGLRLSWQRRPFRESLVVLLHRLRRVRPSTGVERGEVVRIGRRRDAVLSIQERLGNARFEAVRARGRHLSLQWRWSHVLCPQNAIGLSFRALVERGLASEWRGRGRRWRWRVDSVLTRRSGHQSLRALRLPQLVLLERREHALGHGSRQLRSRRLRWQRRRSHVYVEHVLFVAKKREAADARLDLQVNVALDCVVVRDVADELGMRRLHVLVLQERRGVAGAAAKVLLLLERHHHAWRLLRRSFAKAKVIVVVAARLLLCG